MAHVNFQQYYYCDSYFQLELNLQAIRLALIYLLEESDAQECFVCNQLRCRCASSATFISSTLSDPGFSYSELSSASSTSELDYILVTAPPADSLPMPVWRSKSNGTTPGLEERCNDVSSWMKESSLELGGEKLFPINEAIDNDVNRSWPPAPTSIWREMDSMTPTDLKGVSDPVGAFFRYFAEVSRKHGLPCY